MKHIFPLRFGGYATLMLIAVTAMVLGVITSARAECTCVCGGSPIPSPVCTSPDEIGTCWGSCPTPAPSCTPEAAILDDGSVAWVCRS